MPLYYLHLSRVHLRHAFAVSLSFPSDRMALMANLRIASVNVNGIRAAFRKGMGDWLEARDVDVLAMQEVRADDEHVQELLGDGWHILHDKCEIKGRAGVAIASRTPLIDTKVGIGGEEAQSSGRWVEATVQSGDKSVRVISCYMHSGEVDTPRQIAKWAMLDAMGERMLELHDPAQTGTDLVAIVGDLNVGHRELDIKNWKGNRKKSGFLPQERAYFDRFFGPRGENVVGVDESEGMGFGWIDVGRSFHGEVEGPYSWWSNRGQAFDNDTGWRIDYHVVTPELAEKVTDYKIDRAVSYDTRWSDHAAVVVDYAL